MLFYGIGIDPPEDAARNRESVAATTVTPRTATVAKSSATPFSNQSFRTSGDCTSGSYHRAATHTCNTESPGLGYTQSGQLSRVTWHDEMESCFNCGKAIDPDWVFCRACGSDLVGDLAADVDGDEVAAAAAGTTSPKVELISRGWDEVIETVEAPADPFDDDAISSGPLPAGAVEVTVDDITVVETVEAGSSAEEPVEEPADEPATPADPWDHLRPHGELPPLQRYVSIPGRVGQILVLLAAIGALASAGIHFFLNIRLESFSAGNTTADRIDDIELIADWSLAGVIGLVAIAAIALAVWWLRSRSERDFRPGKAGLVALLAFISGAAVTGASFAVKKETVNEAIAANSLIVLGLGLLMTACLAVVRTVDRIDRREPV